MVLVSGLVSVIVDIDISFVLVGLFRYGLVVIGDFFLCLFGLWGHLFNFIHYGLGSVCLSRMLLYMPPDIVQSVYM